MYVTQYKFNSITAHIAIGSEHDCYNLYA